MSPLSYKASYYYWIDRQGVGPTIQTATDFTRALVKLLDARHTHGIFTYPQVRLGGAENDGHDPALLFLAFAVPLVLLYLALEYHAPMLSLAAPVAVFAGLVLERWLFFAKAHPVANLCHGAQRC